MYSETTRSIRIAVEPFYVAEQSEPDTGRYVFGYRVTIENRGGETVQLLARSEQPLRREGPQAEAFGQEPQDALPLLLDELAVQPGGLDHQRRRGHQPGLGGLRRRPALGLEAEERAQEVAHARPRLSGPTPGAPARRARRRESGPRTARRSRSPSCSCRP